MGDDTVSRIVKQVCTAIWSALQPLHMKEPTESDWIRISEEFEQMWQFKNCVGAIDGKHVSIKSPPHSGSDFYNYKHFFSIVLLAVVDANRKFIAIDVGSKGRFSDGGIFSDSIFGKKLVNNQFNLPPDRPLERNGLCVPYVFIGDQGFALRKNLLRPYSRPAVLQNREKRLFNYHLSRARNVVENAFGILAARWRIFRRPFECNVSLVDQVVKAACVLHNYLSATTAESLWIEEPLNADGPISQLQAIQHLDFPLRVTREAFRVRDIFCQHFNSARDT